jgi:pilus assembly protein CpaE
MSAPSPSASKVAIKAEHIAPPPSFFAFVGDDALKRVVAEGARQGGFADAEVQIGDITVAAERLAGVATPRRLLVDLGTCAEPMPALEKLASVCDQGTRVIVVGAANDVNFYRTLLAAGVEDYLVKPVKTEDLVSLFARLSETPTIQEHDATLGDLLVVVGARGGVGATSTASSLAWIFAQEYGRRTALVDLDLHFGACAVGFDLQPSGGLREALANATRIDELFVERAMLKITDSLWLLAPSDELAEAQEFDPVALQRLIETLRRTFRMVVVDLPRSAARSTITAFEPPFSIALISDPSLAGLRDTVKLRTWCHKLAPDVAIHVALNRVGAAPGAELSGQDFETSANLKLACTIPLEAKSAATAVMEAKPLVRVAPKSRAARALRTFATAIAGEPAGRVEAPLWRRIVRTRR